MRLSVLFLLLINFGLLHAQDTLFMKNKDTVSALIREINEDVIHYKQPDFYPDSDFVIAKTLVNYVVFRNGKRQEMDNADAPVVAQQVVYVEEPRTNGQDLFRKGSLDASHYYKHPCGAVATGIITFALGGVVGLVPAIFISLTPPKDQNLGYLDEGLWKEQRYQEGYRFMAKKIKTRKVWTGFGIGAVALGCLVIILYTH